MTTKPDKYISTMEAAGIAGVDYRTIRTWCADERIRAFQISGKWVVDKWSLKKYLAGKNNMKGPVANENKKPDNNHIQE